MATNAAFWMGAKTLSIPMTMFRENRDKVISELRKVRTFEGRALIVLQGGENLSLYDTDVDYVFRQESYFMYLFGVTEPGCYGTVDVATGSTTLFVPRLPAEYAVWMGPLLSLDDFKKKYEVDAVHYADEIDVKLGELNPSVLLTLLYDPQKPIVVAADASPYGVGAVLSHIIDGEEKPVLFASCTLSPAEKNYSQLHREALAIIFAVKRFHKYIYGHRFKLVSDCEALKEIYHPRKGTSVISASRLQRWAVILSMYDYEFEYRPSRCLANADALSRLPVSGGTDIEELSINMLEQYPELPLKTCDVADFTARDEILAQVLEFVLLGWPREVPMHLKYYYNLRKSLSCQDNCLFYGDRLIIPKILQSIVLKMLHTNHDGIVRGKMLARGLFWWKGMQNDVEDHFKQCEVCDLRRSVPKETVVSKWPTCTSPMERIHIDFFDLEGKTVLLIIDSFTKFIEATVMNGTNAKQVNEKLEDFFKFVGLPGQIVSDNGPPFNSWEFAQYWESCNVKVTKSPVYHPQSNGAAERGVQTVKNFLKKRLLDKQFDRKPLSRKLIEILAWYNSTPSTVTGKSPSELIFRYKPRTVLTNINPKSFAYDKNEEVKNSKSVTFDETKNEEYVYDLRSNAYENENCKLKKDFKKGEKVMYRNHLKEIVRWIPAIILDRIGNFLYKIKLIENGSVKNVHLNQIRYPSSCVDGYLTKVPEKMTENVTAKRRRSESLGDSSPSKFQTDMKRKRSGSMNDTIFLRRSDRTRRSPDRFRFEDY